MNLRIALLAGSLALAAGCGGGGGSATGADSAAGIVPETVPAFLSIDTDLSSKQIKSADKILKKFPIRATVLKEIRSGIGSTGVRYATLKRTIGPHLDIAVLDTDTGTSVAFTKPADEKAFEQALQASDQKVVVTRIHGWTAFSDTQAALDEIKHADAKLADADAYKAATGELPGDALAKAYAAGSAVRQGASSLGQLRAASSFGVSRTRWLSAALTAHDDGIELELNVNGKGVSGGPNFKSTLAGEVPSGALVAISFTDAGSAIRKLESSGIPGLGQVESVLGTNLQEIANALADEGMIYVRRGNPIPEVTLVAKEENGQRARRTADTLLRGLTNGAGKRSTTTVAGVKLTVVDLGSVSIFYGTFDGKLVVSDNANAVRDLKGGGDKLQDDTLFKDATGAVGMPDQTNGWIYVNFKDGVPLVEGFAQLAGTTIPRSVDENLRPLRTFVAYASRKGDTETVKLFVQTS